MSIEQNLTAADKWYRGERKDFVFDVGDTLNADGTVSGFVDLTDFSDLQWELRRGAGRAVVFKKQGSIGAGDTQEIVIEDNPDGEAGNNARARVRILAADTEAIEARTYAQVLRELDNGRVLVTGAAVLLDAGLADDE